MVLVVGATGSLGSKIARMLRERGEQVRALVRPTSDTTPLQGAGIDLLTGDLKDPASLARACQGAQVVVTTATVSKRGDDSVDNVDLRGTENLIDAARRAGAGRFVFVSTIGASPDSPQPIFRAKGICEQKLRASGMEFTILEPDAFMDVWFGMLVEMPIMTGQPVTFVGESRRRHSFVAERDVAAFAVAAARHPAARNEMIVIGGPEAITFRDVIAAYEAALGRTIPTRSVSPGDAIPGLPAQVSSIAAALESFDSPVPMDETARVYGVTLTGVQQFARLRARAFSPKPEA